MDPSSGGPCQGIRNLVPALQSLGVEDEVVCLDDPIRTVDPFPIHRIGRGAGPWAFSAALRPWLDRNLERFDAVIVHALWLYHSSAVTRAIADYRKHHARTPKLFVMPHGMLDPWFQNDPSRRLKAYRNYLYWKLLENRVINQADGILFTCQRELELAREPFRPYRPRREFNVGYGVAKPPEFSVSMREQFQQKCPQLKGRSFLLYLSRIHPKKGVDHLLRSYAQLAKNHSEKLPPLVVAGPLDSAFSRQMQALASDLGLTDQSGSGETARPTVYFPGMLQGDAKWGAFYGCEAMVLPSHQENFGIAVVEALACGKPVLISNQINIHQEIAADGAAIVDEDTEEGTMRLLRGWTGLSGPQRAEMAAAAKSCYTNHFLPEAAAKRLIAAINDSVAGAEEKLCRHNRVVVSAS